MVVMKAEDYCAGGAKYEAVPAPKIMADLMREWCWDLGVKKGVGTSLVPVVPRM